MARIPDATQQERPTPQPGTGLASYRPDFGGGEAIGQAMQKAGQDLTGAGNEIYARARVEQEKFDTLKVEEATTALRQKQLDLTAGDSGYTSFKGANALNRPLFQDYTERYKAQQIEIAKSLSTDEQRKRFNARADVGFLQFQEGILHHTIKESDTYAKEVTAGVLMTEQRQATANWESPVDVQVSLVRIDEALKAQGEREGWAPEFLAAKKIEANSKVHSAVVGQAIASGNLVYAQEWYEKYKADIDLNTAKALELATKNSMQRQLDAGYSMQITSARDDIGQLRDVEESISKDGRLDDTRRAQLLQRIGGRIDTAMRAGEMRATRIEKFVERGINKAQTVINNGYEPPPADVQGLFELSRGTPMQEEVDRMIASLNLTRQFRVMSPQEREAELTRLTAAARAGGAVTTQFDTFAALRQAITSAESGGHPDPANALSPENKGGVGRARGSRQITAGTFKDYALPGESYDNEQHRINASDRKLIADFKRYGGDVAKTAAAYIGDTGAVSASGEIAAGKASADVLGTTPRAYADKVVARVKEIMKSTGGTKFDINVLKNLENIHENLKRDAKEDSVTLAVRQGFVSPVDPAATPLDMSKPEALDYTTLQRRFELAAAMAEKHQAPLKPLTITERDQAVATLRRLNTDGKINYFANLMKVASNRGDEPTGPRDDVGGMRAYKAMMAQIAPDEPVLAHAGVAAGRWGDSGEGRRVAELLIEGHAILNPNKRADGTPDTGKLLPMPPESKMRMDFDSATRDAYAAAPGARNAAYQSAKAIYAALSAKAGDKDTQTLDGARWQESIRLAVGEIQRWNGRNTILPPGHDYSRFKDGLYQRIDSVLASGRMIETMTAAKMRDMVLEPVGDGRYIFREGDRKLTDKAGRDVVIDFNLPPAWAPQRAAGAPGAPAARGGRPAVHP
jgi:hypothetical protein